MLIQLEISNVALIEYICIEFQEGFNVLTGETGAGKSIIIDSINAVLGGRTTRDLIRTGCESASVTAVYNYTSENLKNIFQENGIPEEEDGTIIVFREFNNQGRNICRINGKMVTLSVLKSAGNCLVDVHGQHDNQSLLNVSEHIRLLDAFGGETLAAVKREYSEKLSEYRQLKGGLNKLLSSARERLVRLDMLEFQINEIKRAKLQENEDSELVSRRNILVSAEKIKTHLNSAYEVLYDSSDNGKSAYDLISEAAGYIEVLSKIDERYEILAENINEINYQISDVIESIRKETGNISFEPFEIDYVEARLSLINELKRKYGKEIRDIISFLSDSEEEYDKLYNFEESTKNMEEKVELCSREMDFLSEDITLLRKKAAVSLQENIIKHFNDLEMDKVKFKISFLQSEDFMADGKDIIEFLVSTNPGEPLKPLVRIASGGEMSRIMLAIKAVLAGADKIPTLIFDEIDIGISGSAAVRVGEKMSMISRNHQVLCVTHIARIAAFADNNLYIEKSISEGHTSTNVKPLKGNALVMEIARLLDGENYSEATLNHAKEMLGQKVKNL